MEGEIDVDRAWIVEAANAAKGSEMMVEWAVLLHQNDDVLNIANGSCAVVCGDLECPGDVRFQRTHNGGHAQQLHEFAPVGMAHEVPPFLRLCE